VDQTFTLSKQGAVVVFGARVTRAPDVPLPGVSFEGISLALGEGACTNTTSACHTTHHEVAVTVEGETELIPSGTTRAVGPFDVAVDTVAFKPGTAMCWPLNSIMKVVGFRAR
jgi:hypothetical protein